MKKKKKKKRKKKKKKTILRKQSFIYMNIMHNIILYFDAQNCILCFEITHTKQCYIISKFSLK